MRINKPYSRDILLLRIRNITIRNKLYKMYQVPTYNGKSRHGSVRTETKHHARVAMILLYSLRLGAAAIIVTPSPSRSAECDFFLFLFMPNALLLFYIVSVCLGTHNKQYYNIV